MMLQHQHFSTVLSIVKQTTYYIIVASQVAAIVCSCFNIHFTWLNNILNVYFLNLKVLPQLPTKFPSVFDIICRFVVVQYAA